MLDAMKKALKARRAKGLSLKIEIEPNDGQKEDEKSSELAPEVKDSAPIKDGDPEQGEEGQALDPMSIAESVMGKADQGLEDKPFKSLGEKAKIKMMEILKGKNKEG